MTQAAAIRRASQQGRSAMHELDAAGVDDLVRIYQAAADEVRGRINAAVDNTDRESSLQALERLSPEVRAGAIGQTKASYRPGAADDRDDPQPVCGRSRRGWPCSRRGEDDLI